MFGCNCDGGCVPGDGKASFQNLYPGDVSVCNGSCWIITSTLKIMIRLVIEIKKYLYKIQNSTIIKIKY